MVKGKRQLKVLELINNNRNWEEILSGAPYNLIIKKKNQFILLKYNQINSDMSNEIVQECRGLILKKDNIELLSMPPIQQYKMASMRFTKFFNYGQDEAAKLEFNPYVDATEKIDGSLIGVWHDSDTGWHISTSGNIDAEDSLIQFQTDELKNYRDVFNIAWNDFDFNLLDKNLTYIFELVSPYTRVIVPYKETKLYLLGARNNITLEELSYDEINSLYDDIFINSNIGLPKRIKCKSIDEIKKFVDELNKDDANFEGFVLCDNDFNRIKLKSPAYIDLFFIKGEGIFSERKILDLLLKQQEDDILSYFPEYTDDFNRIKHKLISFKKVVVLNLQKGEQYKNRDKKEFAEFAKASFVSDILFKAYGYKFWDKNSEQQNEFISEYIINMPLSRLLDKIKEL